MRDEKELTYFIPHPSALIAIPWRRSQVVRQRSAKPLFIGSIPIAASITSFLLVTIYKNHRTTSETC